MSRRKESLRRRRHVFDGTKSVFITSALDYIKYLDQGSSQQAPAGMVNITIAELEAEVEFITENN